MGFRIRASSWPRECGVRMEWGQSGLDRRRSLPDLASRARSVILGSVAPEAEVRCGDDEWPVWGRLWTFSYRVANAM